MKNKTKTVGKTTDQSVVATETQAEKFNQQIVGVFYYSNLDIATIRMVDGSEVTMKMTGGRVLSDDDRRVSK
jgi:hypothetical protein